MTKIRLTTAEVSQQNEFSQWGEEIAISQVLNLITKDRLAEMALVEFGASRGPDNSNFWKFRATQKLVLIEGDAERFGELDVRVRSMPNVHAVRAWVGYKDGIDDLATLLEEAGYDPGQVVGVSIDIDSDDAAVFEAVNFSPVFVVVEFNPFLPSDGRFRNPEGRSIGNSIAELTAIASEKGYFVACVTPTNLIFVTNAYSDEIQEIDLGEEIMKLDLPRFGWGYDGTLVRFSTSGKDLTQEVYHNGWSDTFIFQPAPKFLRTYKNLGLRRFVRLISNMTFGLLSTWFTAVGPIIIGIKKQKSRNSKSEKLMS